MAQVQPRSRQDGLAAQARDRGRTVMIAVGEQPSGTSRTERASTVDRSFDLRVGLVGPLPPPPGGIANQTQQLARLLEQDGVRVEIVRSNSPYRPRWVGAIRGVRALFRLVPFLFRLWRAAGRVQLFHVMANSGWSWHFLAAPAVWIAKLRGIPVLVNYRGGDAAEFFSRSFSSVRPTMSIADGRIVPSAYLQGVFHEFGLAADIVPNIIDLDRFPFAVSRASKERGAHLVITRHLEPLYDIPTALRAFALIRNKRPDARLTIAGDGSQREMLRRLAEQLEVAPHVTFAGRLDNASIANLYREADLFVNTSLHDNMPISMLEALASGVPVVSSDVCGIPFVVEHGKTAVLVPPGDSDALARAALQVLDDPALREKLVRGGHQLVQQYAWCNVRPRLLNAYREIAGRSTLRDESRSSNTKRSVGRTTYTALCSNVLFPLHEKLKGHDSTARLRALEASQWWSHERIEAHRTAQLRNFLATAAATVPYYENLFREIGFDPARIRAISDLEAIPFLTKPLIRSNTEALKARGAKRLQRSNTGGSSGEPLIFFVDKSRLSHYVAAKWRGLRWWGVDIGDPEIVIWGSPIELGVQNWGRSFRDRVLRSTLLGAFEMSKHNLDRFVKEIRATRPAMLYGYPSVLAHIAKHAESGGERLDDLGINVAFVTAERLYPEQREQIARAFGCPVANIYGGRDSGLIAHECPAGGMHISAEDVIVEIVSEDGKSQPPGVSGEIVVTHLAGKGFPFVRYRTGDVGILDDGVCECGRGLPLIKDLQGRTTDFVVAQDGTIMHGLALIYVVRELPGIAKFKIVQESLDRTEVLLVPEPHSYPDIVRIIKDGMSKRLGSGVCIDVKIVDDIPSEASGKFRYVTSKVAVR
jgi:phenylacetate-CoA ligase